MTRQIPEAAWVTELHNFTNRNAGRNTKLEVDSFDFGAQSQQHGWPLRGIAYDARGGDLLITFGQQSSADHLTHAIAGPSEIHLLIDPRGRDEALAIVDRNSKTLLRFTDL